MKQTQNLKSRSPKQTKSLFSIKEFSGMCGVEQSTLRYWDDIGLFKPAHRNNDTGYRYYSPEQIILINFIKVLSNLSIPLKDIASVSESRSPEAIMKLMEQQELILDTKISHMQEAHSTIHMLRDIMRQGIEVPNTQHISAQDLDAMPIVLGPLNEAWEGLNFYQGFVRYCQYAKENRINLNNPIGGYYDSLEYFLSAPSMPSRFFSVDPRGYDRRAAGKYIVGYAEGYYGKLEGAAQRLYEFAVQQGLNVRGPVYVLFLLDGISVKDTSDYLGQICAALEPPNNKDVSGW